MTKDQSHKFNFIIKITLRHFSKIFLLPENLGIFILKPNFLPMTKVMKKYAFDQWLKA